MIDWMSLKEADEIIIREIMKRVHILLPGLNHGEVQMDIEAAHLCTPLKLETLDASKNQDFLHDIQGIRRHINRHDGSLGSGFAPRCGSASNKVELPVDEKEIV